MSKDLLELENICPDLIARICEEFYGNDRPEGEIYCDSRYSFKLVNCYLIDKIFYGYLDVYDNISVIYGEKVSYEFCIRGGNVVGTEIKYFEKWEEKLSRENVVKKEIEQSTIELKQENDMKIENVTLVDGVQTKDLSEDTLIQAIDNELKKADRLQKLIDSSPSKSKALQIKVKEHLENVEKLTKILDNK